MYLSCLLIWNIISFSVRPAESPGHNVGSGVSKHKRSALNSALGFHLSPAGLVERLYWFHRPSERERSKPPYAAEQDLYPSFSMAERRRAPIRNGLMRAQGPATALQGPRAYAASPGQPSTPLCARSRSFEARGSRASKAASMTKRDGRSGVLMSRFRSCTLCHQRLPDSHDRAHRVVIPHALAYAPISADVDRAVSRGDFREDIQEDFEVQ